MPDDIWSHLRRGASKFGPPPMSTDINRPWLEATGHARSSGRKVVVPPHLQASPQQVNWAVASQEATTRRSQHIYALPKRQVPTNTGPCEERHLPLSKHAPRTLKTRAERLNPPKWQPDREWQVKHCASVDAVPPRHAAARRESLDAFGGVPLSGLISERVIQHVLDEVGEAEEAVDIRDTSGGWAADMTSARSRGLDSAFPPPMPYETEPDAPEGAVARWPLEREVNAWQQKAHAQRGTLSERSTLAVVDDFLSGEFGRHFLADYGQGAEAEPKAVVIV